MSGDEAERPGLGSSRGVEEVRTAVDTKRLIHCSSAIMHRAYNSRQRRTQRDRKSDPNTCTKMKKRLDVIETLENLFLCITPLYHACHGCVLSTVFIKEMMMMFMCIYVMRRLASYCCPTIEKRERQRDVCQVCRPTRV